VRAQTAIVALVLGGLSAAGLRCLDAEEPPRLVRHAEPVRAPEEIDVGVGNTVDPTLLNERALLRGEVPKDTDEAVPLDAPDAGPDAGADAGEPADLEQRFPLHAVAYHFHTQIRKAPKTDARVVGYARRGATFRVSERLSTKGCRRGWHELAIGGFICDGDGVNVSSRPVSFAPAPPAADLASDLPYNYKYARLDNTPEYWRIPTPEETEQVADLFKRLERRDKHGTDHKPAESLDREQLAEVLARAAELAADAGADPLDGGIAEPSLTATPVADPPADPLRSADGGVVDPYALPPFVHLRMAKGYFVSTDDTVVDGEIEYERTVRGRFVQADRLFPAKPSQFSGVLVGARMPLPIAITVRGGVKRLVQETDGGPLKADGKIKRYEKLPYLGVMKRKGKRYVRVGDHEYVPAPTVTVIEPVAPPEDLRPGERWIDVDLSRQTLVAYEGQVPVFATLIASGREGFETPEGSFRIYGKHVTVTMDDPSGGEEAYSIEDVPWTQYFDEGYALHAAFWHDRFGRVRSHGCINLSPADARRLFFWTGPRVPAGVHGIVATRENPGTRVIVHK
jgi:lipoprotein-anchoring transpeptidase ErfK/SrfK